MKIPKQLMDYNFRFFLAGRNKKLPFEKKWNSENNYQFFDPKLIQHIKEGKNYGLVCGEGKLIVLDFDCGVYYNSKKSMLPKTFTIITAGKRLPHVYYLLKDDMIPKVPIDVDNKRVCDIQAFGSGIIAPGSKIGNKYYDLVDDSPIAEITLKQLKEIFKFDNPKKLRKRLLIDHVRVDLKGRTHSIDTLLKLGITQTKESHFKCPFHNMGGNGNLFVGNSSSIYCFHCQRYFKNGNDFYEKYIKKFPHMEACLD